MFWRPATGDRQPSPVKRAKPNACAGRLRSTQANVLRRSKRPAGDVVHGVQRLIAPEPVGLVERAAGARELRSPAAPRSSSRPAGCGPTGRVRAAAASRGLPLQESPQRQGSRLVVPRQLGPFAVDAHLHRQLVHTRRRRTHQAAALEFFFTELSGRNAMPWPSSAMAFRPSAMSVS